MSTTDDEDFVQGVMQPIAQQGKEWFVTEGVEWTYRDMTATGVKYLQRRLMPYLVTGYDWRRCLDSKL